MQATGGATVALQEQAIVDALRKVARTGLLPELTSATAIAGLDHLIQAGTVRESEETVVILTATGIKNADAIAEMFA